MQVVIRRKKERISSLFSNLTLIRLFLILLGICTQILVSWRDTIILDRRIFYWLFIRLSFLSLRLNIASEFRAHDRPKGVTPHCWEHLVLVPTIHISPLLRTFGFSTISTYNSYLPLTFGKFALIWCYFQNICACRFWGHWGQRTIDVEFWGCDLEIWQSFLKVWLPTSKK